MLQHTQDEIEKTNKEVADVERTRKISQQRVGREMRLLNGHVFILSFTYTERAPIFGRNR